MDATRHTPPSEELALTTLELMKLNVFDEIRVLGAKNPLQDLSDFHYARSRF